MELQKLKGMIYVVRNQQVMIDSDLAMLYQVETGNLNKAMKRDSKLEALEVKYTKAFHDRFLILDRETVYHVEVSLSAKSLKSRLLPGWQPV